MMRVFRQPWASQRTKMPRIWRAILIATLLLAPAYWSLLIGVVSLASNRCSPPITATIGRAPAILPA